MRIVFKRNSSIRCPTHNAEVGGVPNSQHVLGTAADITIPEIGFERARELVESIDFDGTGFYPLLDDGGAWFIHVDVRDGGIGSYIVWWNKKNRPGVFVTLGLFHLFALSARCLQTDIPLKNYGENNTYRKSLYFAACR